MRRWWSVIGVALLMATLAVTVARNGTEAAGPEPTAAPTSEESTSTEAGSTSSASSSEATSSSQGSTTTTGSRARPPRYPTTVAVATNPAVTVHDRPEGRAVSVLHSPARFSGMPQVFVVVPAPDAPPGWLHVGLRTRPNGSTGWIRASDVVLDQHNWSIDINLTERWATVYDGPNVFAQTPVVVGTDVSPTPEGDSFIVEAVWTDRPNGAYGPFVYGLSSHSEVYTEFAGGDGQIGLHGTNQPGLLGTAASHGCVRFPNDVILRMANALPMGVPVHTHR